MVIIAVGLAASPSVGIGSDPLEWGLLKSGSNYIESLQT